MKKILLLNAGYEPLNFINPRRAIGMLTQGRAEVVVNMDGNPSNWANESYSSPSTKIIVPATLRLLNRVTFKRFRPRFSKKILFARDNWSCQYCNKKLSPSTAEVEHILPTSRGGINSWTNCVTSCHKCNSRKANNTPAEAGMKLLSKPLPPTKTRITDFYKSLIVHEDWRMFLSHLKAN